MKIDRRTFLYAGAASAVACLCGSSAALAGTAEGWTAGGPQLRLDLAADGRYQVSVFGKPWLAGSGCALHCGQWFKAMPRLSSHSGAGQDALGSYQFHSTTWDAQGTPFETAFRVYRERPCIVFSQSFPGGARNVASRPLVKYDVSLPTQDFSSAINDCGISSVFPAFELAQMPDLRHLSFFGCFAEPRLGRRLENLSGGSESGVPIVLFDSDRHTVVLSPLNHFLNAVQMQTEPFADCLSCGLSGQVESVPAGFKQEFVLFAGAGINQTVFDWGSLLLKLGGKSRGLSDPTVEYLGYWTDNGAYHYYHPEPGKRLADTLVEVARDLRARAIPVGYLQLDSWWYNRSPVQEPQSWLPQPQVLPDGVGWVRDQTGLALALHSRYWARANQYQQDHPFVVGEGASLPTGEDFWRQLMQWARANGACLYEQDWLNAQFERTFQLRTDPGLGEKWLEQMDRAAGAQSIRIMYCMPLPSFYLASSCCPQVTQIRASTDYAPGSSQWRIGKTSMLAWALGMAPFKDVFWSTPSQPGYPSGKTEPNCELQALVSAWSCGAVGCGDRVGLADKQLLLRTCRADGLLLKPDRPAMAIDVSYVREDLTGEVWDTLTRIGGSQWHFLLCADQAHPSRLSLADLGLSSDYLLLDLASRRRVPLDPAGGFSIGDGTAPGPGATGFQYFMLAPLDRVGFAFLGEVGKFVGVSRQRFGQISDSGASLELEGSPGERVTLEWQCPQQLSVQAEPAGLVSYDPALSRLRLRLKLGTTGRAAVTLQR